ncbi:hypothetical protein [Pseudoalteromonas 'SMAR']|uniref:hypothetical protein n=1 Tax=Pseudoalteromonas 'SMAR' TaxID=3416908 RepID=UPI003AF22CB3
MKLLILGLLITALLGCQSSPKQAHLSGEFVGPIKSHQGANYAPLATVINAQLKRCEDSNEAIIGAHFKGAQQLQQFIRRYCGTDSTTAQLKLIANTKQQHTWPDEYLVWLDALAWHTQQLRAQKIDNYYSNNAAKQHQQQLLKTQKQLSELKQKLANIEKQRLESDL